MTLRNRTFILNHRIYICKGRITGDYPIYIPSNTMMSQKLVAHAHLKTLHGEVGYTTAEVRERFWIPKLRQLTKHVIHLDRTSGSRQSQVIGIDFARPLTYIKKRKQEGKAYILVYSCSLTQAVYMDLMRDENLKEFLTSLQRFIARRGKPEKIYSDNVSTL